MGFTGVEVMGAITGVGAMGFALTNEVTAGVATTVGPDALVLGVGTLTAGAGFATDGCGVLTTGVRCWETGAIWPWNCGPVKALPVGATIVLVAVFAGATTLGCT